MANFTTEDDKRIYDLQSENSPLLNMFLPIDKSGNSSAKRISLQQIVDLLTASGPKLKAYASTVNPDNAFGNDGDLFFTIPASGSKIQLWQRAASVWGSIFNLPLINKVILETYTGSTINSDGNLVLSSEDKALVLGKQLIGVLVNGDPLKGVDYWPSDGYIDGFGGFFESTDLEITITFI